MLSPSQPKVTESSVHLWRWIAAVLALSQLAAPWVVDAVAGDFLRSGATNQALITPAGYAFGLWGVICLLSAATALAVLRWGLGSWWEKAVLVDASVVFTGFSVWLVVAAQDWLWISVAVFAVMVAALIHIMRRLVRRSHDLTCPRWLAVLATVTFGLYLGWSSIAVFANVAAALIDTGVPAASVGWQVVVLLAAGAFALWLTTVLRGSPGFVAGVLWALVAIVLGAWQRDSAVLSATPAIAGAVVLGAAAAQWRRVRR